ncbi:MAG TPA: phage tail tape measure protein, partial [Ktedonobacteraceae bacterium]
MPDVTLRMLLQAQDQYSGTFGKLTNGLGNINFGLRNLTTSGNIGMGAISQGAVQAGNALWKVAGVAALAGAAVALAVGVKSVQAANKFQAGLTQLETGAGESAQNLQKVGNNIKEVSVQTGTSTDDLLKSMFLIESANYRGSASTQVLAAAAQGAKTQNADLTQTTDVLATAMHNYSLQASQAVPTMNGLIETVKNGRMHMDDLNGALRTVLPVSSALQVPLSNVEGALSTMANSGDKGAAAGTHLAMMLKMLENPASTAQKEMSAMGLDSVKLAETMKTSLPGALQMIQNAVAQHFTPGSVAYNRAIATILGGSRSGVAGLELMGQNLKTFANNTNDATGVMKRAGSSVMGWSAIQGTFNQKMDQAKAALNVLFINIGTALLPVLTRLMAQVTPIIQSFTNWVTKSNAIGVAVNALATGISTLITWISNTVVFFQKNELALDALRGVLIVVASIIGGLMTASLISATGAAIGFLIEFAPIIAAVLILSAVVGGVILAIQHWGQITSWLRGIWSGVSTALVSGWNTIKNVTSSTVSGIVNWYHQWQTVINIVAGAILVFFLPALIKVGVQSLISGAQIAGGFIANVVRAGAEAVVSGAKTAVSFVDTMILAGAEAATTGSRIAMDFVASMIKSGVEAVVNGAKIAASFVVSLVRTGLEGWASAGKLGLFIAQMVVSGAQAVINGAKIAASFIASLVTSGAQAVISAGIFLTTLVPSLLATAAAAIAAAAPFVLVGLIVAAVVVGIVLAVTHWGQIMHWLQGVTAPVLGWIQAAWSTALGWLQTALQVAASFFVKTWTGIKVVVQTAIAVIVDILKAGALLMLVVLTGPLGLILALIITHWSQVKSVFTESTRTITSTVSSFINGLVNWFQQLPGRALSFITSFAAQAAGAFNNLIAQSPSWGANVIQGFINGITSKLAAVGNAVSSVAHTVAQYLGFHSPAPLGPGRDADKWGPALINMFARDIKSTAPKARQAAEQMMSGVEKALLAYPVLIAQATETNNKAQEKSLKNSQTMLNAQLRAYKSLT